MGTGWQGEADRLSREDAEAGRPATDWFERLWAAGVRGDHDLPWDREEPNPLLVGWLASSGLDGGGRSALVVGAGLGREAGHLARAGFRTTAFDVSPTAVALAAEREPGVEVVVADLLDLPPEWREAFDLVVEIYTVQALPLALREDAVAAVTSTVAPGGTLLVVQAVRSEGETVEGPPWPLTEAEVRSFTDHGLVLDELEELHVEGLGGRRWRARFSRPGRP